MTAQPAPDSYDGAIDALIADLTSTPPDPAAPLPLQPPVQPNKHPAAPEPRVAAVRPEQIEDVLGVLNEAARWLVDHGYDQWPPSFTEDGWRAEKLRDEAAAGHVFAVYLGHRPIATATITPWADPDFAHAWPAGTVDDALYVLRLASTQAARNLGLPLGAWLLEFAVQQALFAGKSRVRLDCMRDNPGLHSYYLRNGFKPMGLVKAIDVHTGKPRRSGALFERVVPAAPAGGDWS